MRILVIGAGRSTGSLIEYLLEHSGSMDATLVVADRDVALAERKTGGHPRASAVAFELGNVDQLKRLVSACDLVVSMLPAELHVNVAKECIAQSKHMVTASYLPPVMASMNDEARAKGLILLNEIGVDPGIDHLSAVQILDRLRARGVEMRGFESFTGGLPAPSSDNNPWNYKFTWNPRNVVLAGAGGAVKFIQEGQYKYIPYHQVFRRTEFFKVDGYGRFEGYANRDSLRYRSVYGLDSIPTIYRGTLRRPGFCRAWDVFVKLGMTDDSYRIEASCSMSWRQFTNTFLAYHPTDSVELKFRHYLGIAQDDPIMDKFEWLGLFSNEPIGLEEASPAEILQKKLEEKWKLEPGERDMIVMHHLFDFVENGVLKRLTSSMVYEGLDDQRTAMAQTVGLPVGIAVRLILSGQITQRGVLLPIHREFYEPMLRELEGYGVRFVEREG
ncbi:saccharopine dehydrogenase [bacterium]|nr:saccharopine dehydrogenase [bacterium]